jgi:hypothetical protein
MIEICLLVIRRNTCYLCYVVDWIYNKSLILIHLQHIISIWWSYNFVDDIVVVVNLIPITLVVSRRHNYLRSSILILKCLLVIKPLRRCSIVSSILKPSIVEKCLLLRIYHLIHEVSLEKVVKIRVLMHLLRDLLSSSIRPWCVIVGLISFLI